MGNHSVEEELTPSGEHRLKNRLREQLEYIRAGGHVQRFHTKRTLMIDFVGHHSFNVAWLVHFMSPHLGSVERYTLLLAALEHDLPEGEMGDVPAPSKRELGIRQLWGEAEAQLQAEMGLGYESALSAEGKRLLKLADALDGALFSAHERAMGNTTMGVCYENFISYANEVINRDRIHERMMFEIVTEAWEKVNA